MARLRRLRPHTVTFRSNACHLYAFVNAHEGERNTNELRTHRKLVPIAFDTRVVCVYLSCVYVSYAIAF